MCYYGEPDAETALSADIIRAYIKVQFEEERSTPCWLLGHTSTRASLGAETLIAYSIVPRAEEVSSTRSSASTDLLDIRNETRVC